MDLWSVRAEDDPVFRSPAAALASAALALGVLAAAPPTATALTASPGAAAGLTPLAPLTPIAAPAGSTSYADRARPAGDARGDLTPAQRARAALQVARAATGGSRSAAPARDVTLALRDLWMTRGDLGPAGRRAAGRLLARPTDPRDADAYSTRRVKRVCGVVCVHWVETTVDRVPLADRNRNRRPDYVDRALATMTSVYTTYRRAGYRTPKPDGRLGGNGKLDVYLLDSGRQGYYGSCSSDQRNPADGTRDVWAYCILDNDFARRQFPTNTPIENLQVTAAHEYLHAIQAAYDWYEDSWLLEATATWAEDELYDRVDDNLQYLEDGPLGRPEVPLDLWTSAYNHQYGDWLFFRYLTERYRAERGGLPVLVRDVLEVGRNVKPSDADLYSLQAIEVVLGRLGTSFADELARFSDANLRPGASYSEGEQNRYVRFAPDAYAPFTDLGDDVYGIALDHQAAASIGYDLDGSEGTVQLEVDGPPSATAPRAVLRITYADGAVETGLVDLGVDGEGFATVALGAPAALVEVTVVNASTRYTACGSNRFGKKNYGCGGRSVDDDLPFAVRVSAG